MNNPKPAEPAPGNIIELVIKAKALDIARLAHTGQPALAKTTFDTTIQANGEPLRPVLSEWVSHYATRFAAGDESLTAEEETIAQWVARHAELLTQQQLEELAELGAIPLDTTGVGR